MVAAACIMLGTHLVDLKTDTGSTNTMICLCQHVLATTCSSLSGIFVSRRSSLQPGLSVTCCRIQEAGSACSTTPARRRCLKLTVRLASKLLLPYFRCTVSNQPVLLYGLPSTLVVTTYAWLDASIYSLADDAINPAIQDTGYAWTKQPRWDRTTATRVRIEARCCHFSGSHAALGFRNSLKGMVSLQGSVKHVSVCCCSAHCSL